MDKLVPSMYRDYGLYVNYSRSFPLSVDGLKPVERRILLSAYEIARDKFIKSARVDGHVIGHYHPHGSSYGSIVQLVNQGFLAGQGNFGNNAGVESSPAAAMRYTEIRLSKFINDLTFKLIDYVPVQDGELDDEPAFLPTMLPLCLLGNEYTQGIGFGFKTLIPCYKVEDLKHRLLFLLGKEKTKPIIKPISDCEILSGDKELEQILTTGKGQIQARGMIDIDYKHCKVIIKSWPFSKRFESILGKFSKELENADIGYTDLSTDKTKIIFEVIKQRSRDDIIKMFVKKLQAVLTGSISFEMTVVTPDKKIRLMSVDELLLGTYKMFTSINEVMLKTTISKIDDHISENKLLQKIIPFLKKHMGGKETIEVIVELISKDSGIDKDIIMKLFQKHTISKLLKVSFDTDDLEKQKLVHVNNLQNIEGFVLDQYKKL